MSTGGTSDVFLYNSFKLMLLASILTNVMLQLFDNFQKVFLEPICFAPLKLAFIMLYDHTNNFISRCLWLMIENKQIYNHQLLV